MKNGNQKAGSRPKAHGDALPGASSLPLRQCALTRERAPKHTLLRLAVGPDGIPFVDLVGRAPGRGVYVRASREVLTGALTAKGARRAFRGRARPLAEAEAEAVVEETYRRLEHRMLDLVALARRAGACEIGLDATLRALEREPDLVLVTATDLSAGTEKKVAEAVRRRTGVRWIRLATKDEIGSRLGRTDVGVLGLRRSPPTTRLGWEADRRRGLRSVQAQGEVTS